MSHRIKFITIIGIFTLNCVFNAHANTANDIYRMAQQSPSRITTISDIDALDSSGNTALCNAILNDDVATYNTLVKYGADKKHECVKNISKKKYDKFIAKTTSASSKTFLGLGKWGWGGILGGVAVAGAAAAMGGGSGGGGGGDSAGSTGTGNNPPPSTPGNDDWTEYDAWVRAEFPFAENAPCPNGYTHSECRALSTGEYYCKCDNYVNCPSSYQIQCQNGFHETSNTCQSGPNILKECVADTCPSDYKTNCGNGYHAGQTCQSGDTTYMECVANTCDGFNYLETDTCPKGWLGGSACQSGDVTKYKCDLPDTCPHNYKTSCGAGYHATENTCQSGNEILYECIENTCPSDYKTSCNTGYHVGNTCQSGDTTYMECVADTCDGFDYDASSACPVGWTIGTSCQAGNTTKYKCDKPATCPSSYQEKCTTGWTDTSDTCKSGYKTLYKCRECGINATWTNGWCECNEGYTIQSGASAHLEGCTAPKKCLGYYFTSDEGCPEGYELGSSCLSGEERKYKCDVRTQCPDDYKFRCTGGWQATSDTCKSGSTTYIKCEKITCDANAQWTEDGCVCKDGYVGDGTVCTRRIVVETTTSKEPVYGQNVLKNHVSAHVEARGIETQIGEMYVFNHSDGDAYGMYAESSVFRPIYNAHTYSDAAHAKGTITVYNLGSGTAYGMYASLDGVGKVYNETYTNPENPDDVLCESTINIYNLDGTAYGMWGHSFNSGTININTLGQSTSTAIFGHAENTGTINMTSKPFKDAIHGQWYGYPLTNNDTHMIGISGFGNNSGTISIDNAAYATGFDTYGNTKNMGGIDISNISTKAIGMHLVTSDSDVTSENTGDIKLNNISGDAYGMAMETGHYNHIKNSGTITIINATGARTYGMHTVGQTGTVINNSDITINAGNNGGTGDYYGMFANGLNWFETRVSLENHGKIDIGTVDAPVNKATGMMNTTDSDDITLHEPFAALVNDGELNLYTTGSAIGISGTGPKTTITNTENGAIKITNTAQLLDGQIIGIFATGGATVTNNGSIIIDVNANNIDRTYGIYASGDGTSVKNTGTITINGYSCVGENCNGFSNNHIVLENGATFINGGEMSASAFDFDSMNGNVVATNGAQFIAENDISGTLNLSSDIVADGFDTTYVAENMIQAGDTSKLTLRSGSAMFDAKLADNGNDVVMTMKSFDTLTDNKSLAAYLTDNYTKGTSAEFFGGLKSGANMAEFNNILNGLSGLNAFTQFDREDMSAMREINFSMNQQMFMNGDRDEYQVSGAMEHFSFSNSSNGGSGSYGISNSRMSDNWKLGYGLAMANIGTNDDFGTSRSNQIGLFYMPMTYTNDNIEFISTPRVGFAKSHYSRRGYNNMNYDGYIEKQIFGFNNDLRYPMTFGNWTIAPDLGFNAIMYRQSGHESDQAFSLIIPADEIYSVEAGFGLFTKYEHKLDNGSLRFNSGVMLYRELADTYNMKLGIRGLDGTFNLYDDAEHNYSGAATLGFDYKSGRFSLYGNAQYFVDSDAYTNVKAGFRLHF